MNPRVLAVLIPVAILVAACSSSAVAPTWTYAASAVAVADPSPAIAAPSAAPSVAPSAEALTGEVAVSMTDAMRFEPGAMTVKIGEPITFVVKNAGVIVHEFFVGTESEQVDHAAEMAMGQMSHGHDNALSVEPGKTGSLTWPLRRPGRGWSAATSRVTTRRG